MPRKWGLAAPVWSRSDDTMVPPPSSTLEANPAFRAARPARPGGRSRRSALAASLALAGIGAIRFSVACSPGRTSSPQRRLVLLPFLAGGGDVGASIWSLAFLPIWVGLAKGLGLYDRDERALRHATIDEAPHVLLWGLIGASLLALVLSLTPAGQPTASSTLVAGGRGCRDSFPSPGVGSLPVAESDSAGARCDRRERRSGGCSEAQARAVPPSARDDRGRAGRARHRG